MSEKSVSLGKNTRVTNSKNPRTGLAGLTLTRVKYNGSETNIFLEYDECESLRANLVHISEVIDTMQTKEEGEAMLTYLKNSWVAEVSKYQGRLFSGIFMILKDGTINRGCGMNFNLIEWGKLARYVAATGDDDSARPLKRVRQDSEGILCETIQVKQYMWKWLYEERDDRVIVEAETWYLSDEACLDSAMANRPDCRSRPKMDSRTLMIQCNEAFVEYMYLFLMEQRINECKNQDCEGCELDCPGQRDHMNGCLMKWEDAIVAYMDEAKNSVNIIQMLQLFHRLTTFVGSPCQATATVLKQLASFKPPQDVEDKLNKMPMLLGDAYHDVLAACFTA